MCFFKKKMKELQAKMAQQNVVYHNGLSPEDQARKAADDKILQAAKDKELLTTKVDENKVGTESKPATESEAMDGKTQEDLKVQSKKKGRTLNTGLFDEDEDNLF